MNLSIFGTGYVGLVSGACLAEVGHHVICVDLDDLKINNLKVGILPVWEPGLDALVERNVKEGRLHFTTDAAHAVQHGQVQFIAVGTPPEEDGSADMQYVLNVAKSIATHMTDYKVIVNKSTVPVGTADIVADTVNAVLAARVANGLPHRFAPRNVEVEGVIASEVLQSIPTFDVVSNPEFLKEGAAVNDFLKPDRIIIGTHSEGVKSVMRELYEPFNRNRDRTIFMDVRSAELTKYAANAMLATKISFMNEIANLAELLGADIEEVRKGVGADPRIGYHFIYPGCGYGGSCFPKDVQALTHTAKQVGYSAQLLQAVEAVNNRQKGILFAKMSQHFGGSAQLKGKIIAVWGLAFKPNTDDMRAAPSRTLMEAIWQNGGKVQAFDPVAMEEAARIYSQETDLNLCTDKYAALENADALIICTEWQHFRAPDFAEMAARMRNKVIVDGRNLYQPNKLQSAGWVYLSVGRATT
jgi:UDPglucose 6-dehydrogenase